MIRGCPVAGTIGETTGGATGGMVTTGGVVGNGAGWIAAIQASSAAVKAAIAVSRGVGMPHPTAVGMRSQVTFPYTTRNQSWDARSASHPHSQPATHLR